MLNDHPEWAFVSGGFRYVAENGSAISNPVIAKFSNDNFAMLLRENYIAMGSTVVYRRKVLEQIGGFDPSLRACEDWDVYLKIARKYPIGQHRHLVSHYRRHDLNMSGNSELMLGAAFDVLNRQLPYVVRDPHLRRSYQEGISSVCRHYQNANLRWTTLFQLLARQATHGSPLRLAWLLRYTPWNFWRLLARSLASSVVKASRRITRKTGTDRRYLFSW